MELLYEMDLVYTYQIYSYIFIIKKQLLRSREKCKLVSEKNFEKNVLNIIMVDIILKAAQAEGQHKHEEILLTFM